MNVKEKSRKRKSKLSPELCRSPRKKISSTQTFSDDEAYHPFSCITQSVRKYGSDVTVGDLPEPDEGETQTVISKDSLKIQYKYLLREMEPQCLIDHLHRSDMFSDKFLEECAETKGRQRRNDLLIKEIFNISHKRKASVLQVFTDALIKTEQSFIVDHLIEQSSDEAGATIYEPTTLRLFSIMKDRLEKNIEPRDFIDDLIVKKAISFDDHEDITRLDLRKKRVDFIMDKIERRDNGYLSIITTIAQTYPKLFKEFEHKIENACSDDIGSEGGDAINIRLHLKRGSKGVMRPMQLMSLRQIESQAVKRFNKSQEENREIDALVQKCKCKFEGLKISSVVIQLLTRSGDSLEKVLRMIQSGKAVDWLLSVLNENDKNILISLGVTKLQVTVSVNEGGNLNCLLPVKDCICHLNKQNIQKNKTKLYAALTDIHIFIHQMSAFGVPISRLGQFILEGNSSDLGTKVLDFLAGEESEPVWICLLEEHIKTVDQSVLEHLFRDDCNEHTTLLSSDVKQHEDFLIEELELNSFLPTIRSWESEDSVRFLAKLRKCSCRSSRMAEFIRFLLDQDDLTWFWEKVKEKHSYVWAALISSKQTIQQSKTDLIAAQLMNDIVIEEVDPLRLKQYMREATVAELGCNEFETIRSRKLQAQYMMNRLNTNNICDFMVALNRAGYDNVFREIKAGSLAKHYVCPRINGAEKEIKHVFNEQFDLSVGLDKGKISSSGSIINGTDSIAPNLVQMKLSMYPEKERMLRLIDSDMSVSGDMLQRSPRCLLTKRLTTKNCIDAEKVENNLYDDPLKSVSKQTNRKTEKKDREEDEVKGRKTSTILISDKKGNEAVIITPRRNIHEGANNSRTVVTSRKKMEFGDRRKSIDTSSDSVFVKSSNKSDLKKGLARQTRSMIKLLEENVDETNGCEYCRSSISVRKKKNSTGCFSEGLDSATGCWVDECVCSTRGSRESSTPEPKRNKSKLFGKGALAKR